MLCLRRPLSAEKKGSEPANVIEMKMADPDGIKVRPIKVLLSHTMRGVRTAIKQHRSVVSFHPMRRRRPMSMRN